MFASEPSGPVDLINREDAQSISTSCHSMFDTSTRRKEASSSRIDVRSYRPDREDGKVQIWKENTFQLGPHSKFLPRIAKEIAQQVVQDSIPKGSSYSPEWARLKSLEIAAQVKRRLKLERQNRYKFVVQSFIGQKSGQGLMLGSRYLNNQDTDSQAEFTFQNSSLWCTVLIYSLYCE